ncbi:hypothetical protein PXK56_18345 [Phaeobacter gallaeciensis]|uniref:hypothetical protein n=1 Tax=Phaeobacter gallaeciensis TaxID=60890 RepID=UPI0023806679|nr:hypothetical protein [Phaeobacter gallaeciensis]MDE4297148.1 hypothetical protein [Phaeobacter gallaeciensis]
MPWFMNGDGSATEVQFDTPEFDERAEKERWYGTLAGAVIHEGVMATAFDRAIIADPLYDGAAWLEGQKIEVGIASTYRIVATPGVQFHPSLSPTDFRHVLDAAASLPAKPSSAPLSHAANSK